MTLQLFLILFSLRCTLAYDFLVWTSSDQTSEIDWKLVKEALTSASPENSVYLFAIQNITIEDAARQLNDSSRSGFCKLESEQRLKVPDASDVQYFLFDNFEDYTTRAPTFPDKFLVVLSEPPAFDVELHRKKRVSLNQEEDAGRRRDGNERQTSKGRQASYRRPSGSGKSYSMPVILPPFNRDKLTPKNADEELGTCLFYMESLVVYVFNKKSQDPFACAASVDSLGRNKFIYSPGTVDCIQTLKEGTLQEFSFTVEVDADKVKGSWRGETFFVVDGPISIKLTFQTGPGFTWSLVGVETDGFSVSGTNREWLPGELSVASGARANEDSISSMEVGAPLDYNYACSETRVATFKTNNKNYNIGIAFGNVQIQPIGYETDKENKNARFSIKTYDCIGIFSPASLMGIIVTLVLASTFVFGFLMLISVQTMDRFDNPKGKQLVINFKE